MPRLLRLVEQFAIAGLLIGTPGSHLWAEEKQQPGLQLARTPAEARERLSRIVDVTFEDVKVCELSSRLEKLAGIVTWVDPRALRGVDTDKIYFCASTISVTEALDSLLRLIGCYWSLKGATLYVASEDTTKEYGVCTTSATSPIRGTMRTTSATISTNSRISFPKPLNGKHGLWRAVWALCARSSTAAAWRLQCVNPRRDIGALLSC
jgi:hypothetical protein